MNREHRLGVKCADTSPMEFDEVYQQRVDALLDRAADALTEMRALSHSERVEHAAELLGLVHALTSVERDLGHAPPAWAYARHAVWQAIDLLGERIRILSADL